MGSSFHLRLGNGFPIPTSCLRISDFFFLVDHGGEAEGKLRVPGLQGEKSKLVILKSFPVWPQPPCSAVSYCSPTYMLCSVCFCFPVECAFLVLQPGTHSHSIFQTSSRVPSSVKLSAPWQKPHLQWPLVQASVRARACSLPLTCLPFSHGFL